MGDLKPIGSEKLPVNDKINRIMEIANYGVKPKQAITNPTSTVANSKTVTNGVYAVVRERDGYYVKYGLNESTLDYIGGMKMKNKNRFNSYAEANKRMELIARPLTEQEKKYMLNTPAMDEDPAEEPAMDAPAPEATDAPVDDMGGEEVPADDMGGEEMPVDDMGGEMGDVPVGGAMKSVQKLVGKLGQKLRELADDMESDDIKYVLNSVISALDITKLTDDDRDSILNRFEDDNYDGMDADMDINGDAMDDASAMGDMEGGEELPADDEMGGGEEVPAEEPAPEDEELGEGDDIFEAFKMFNKLMK